MVRSGSRRLRNTVTFDPSHSARQVEHCEQKKKRSKRPPPPNGVVVNIHDRLDPPCAKNIEERNRREEKQVVCLLLCASFGGGETVSPRTSRQDQRLHHESIRRIFLFLQDQSCQISRYKKTVTLKHKTVFFFFYSNQPVETESQSTNKGFVVR